MSFFNDVLGNPPEEKKTDKKTDSKSTEPTQKDVPVSKPAEPQKASDPKPAEPQKASDPKPAEPQKASDPKPAEPDTTKSVDKPKKSIVPPVVDSAPTMADLKAKLDEKENIYTKISIKISATEFFAKLTLNEKLRLISEDSSENEIVNYIVKMVVQNTSDSLLEQYGAKLLDVAFDCDDLRDKMLKKIVGNNEWVAYAIDAIAANTAKSVLAEDKILKEFSDALISDKDSLNKVVGALLASDAGRKAIYDAIR